MLDQTPEKFHAKYKSSTNTKYPGVFFNVKVQLIDTFYNLEKTLNLREFEQVKPRNTLQVPTSKRNGRPFRLSNIKFTGTIDRRDPDDDPDSSQNIFNLLFSFLVTGVFLASR